MITIDKSNFEHNILLHIGNFDDSENSYEKLNLDCIQIFVVVVLLVPPLPPPNHIQRKREMDRERMQYSAFKMRRIFAVFFPHSAA